MVNKMKWLLLCVKINRELYIHGSTINSNFNKLYKEIGIAVYLTQAHKSCFPGEKKCRISKFCDWMWKPM